MASSAIHLEIQTPIVDVPSSPFKRQSEASQNDAMPAMSGLDASLQSVEDESFLQYMETFFIEVYRCTICKSCFTQKSAIHNHIKLSHFEGHLPKFELSSQSVHRQDDVPGYGKQALESHPQGENHYQEKEKIADKENVKHCTTALSSALEVLVGLGGPGLIEETPTNEKLREDYNLESCRREDFPAPVCSSELPVAVAQDIAVKSTHISTSLGHVSLDLGNQARDLVSSGTSECDKASLEGAPVLVLNSCRNPTVKSIAENVSVLFDCPTTQVSISDEAEDKLESDVAMETPQATPLEDLPGNKAVTSVVLNHTSQHPEKDPVDIDGLVRSASDSNPEASLITVVTQTGTDKRLEMLQFKRSSKSNAIIPTAQSLGIVSPFPKPHRISKKKFSCETCFAKYATEEELKRHISKKHLRKNKFLCEICGLALATKASFKNHNVAKHSSIEMYQCDKCSYQTRFEKHFKNHRAKHSSEIWCEVCSQTFISTAKLKLHCKSPMHVNKLNPMMCPQCDYKTYKKDNMRVHMRKHTGQRPYQCTQCQYASADGSTLKKHVMAKHFKIRPFRCKQCDFSCVDNKSLTIHMRKHTGERPFKCHRCDYAAKRHSALASHMQTHGKLETLQVRQNIDSIGINSDGQVMSDVQDTSNSALNSSTYNGAIF